MTAPASLREASRITHFHLFCGSGSGAYGFNLGHARVGALDAEPVCVGGIDVDATACADFRQFVGVPAACMDLFTREQFLAFHGQCVVAKKRCRGCSNTGQPPLGWREASGADVLRAAGGHFPDVVFTSSPCKGLSGLLSTKSAGLPRYQALNQLTVRGIRLTVEAFADCLPKLIIFENVPRIENRGAHLIAEIREILEGAGYAVSTTTHDCGELGGLAQHRRRFLLVARHRESVRPFLYEPPMQRVRGVGEVLGEMPMPDDEAAGPMHTSPRLDWRTWVRLALIPAGGDWRSLQDLDFGRYRIEPLTGWNGGVLGVKAWDQPGGTVTGRSAPTTGAFAVGDPRVAGQRYNHCYRVVRWEEAAQAVTSATGNASGVVADPRSTTEWVGKGKYKVTEWEQPAGTVIAADGTGNGAFAVSDPRPPEGIGDYHAYGVTPWDGTAETVTSKTAAGSGRGSVADPRVAWGGGQLGVKAWDQPAGTIAGESYPTNGANSVADPRLAIGDPRVFGEKGEGDDWAGNGHYGVLPWADPSGAVTGRARADTGTWSVADPRPVPADDDRPSPAPIIVSLDNTWHRPFTTLELMALQSYPWRTFIEKPLGGSDAARREHIGNAVPAASAKAIASEMYRTILLQRAGQSFVLSATPIWVQPILIGLSVAQYGDRL